VLSLFALAGYRLLPALSKASNGAAQLSHHLPVIDAVYSDMRDDLQPEQTHNGSDGDELEFLRHIQLNGVGFRYKTTNADVISGIDLTVPKGAKVALTGSTGSGKSTLIDIMVGLLLPVEGTFSVDGTPITLNNVERWRRKVAYVPQEEFLYDDTIANNIAFGVPPQQIDMGRIRDSARIAQIDEFISSELPDGYDTRVGERGVRLSGGQRQRIGLARAFYRQPEVLLLDEATSGLDGITEEAIMSTLRDELPTLTVIIIAHRLSAVKFCQRIYVLDGGRIIAAGNYYDLLASNENFKQMVELTSRENPCTQ
jgi:ATP-binding cassette subfamily C protein